LVIELRRDRRASIDDAMSRALRGMRVDRAAFRRHVLAHRDKFLRAVAPAPLLRAS
jgi:hypothetical protein